MRAVIAEDAVLLREGLARLLEEGGFDVVDCVSDGEALLRSVEAHQPDVCVVDIRMPPTFSDEGVRAALVIRKQWPDVSLLMLSQYVEERYAVDLLAGDSSGIGYLLKDRVADVSEFLEALRRVAAGGAALDPEVVTQLLVRSGKKDPLEPLSPREREVLGLMAEGRTNSSIAENIRARKPPTASAKPRCARAVTCDRAPGSAGRRARGDAPGRRGAGRA